MILPSGYSILFKINSENFTNLLPIGKNILKTVYNKSKLYSLYSLYVSYTVKLMDTFMNIEILK